MVMELEQAGQVHFSEPDLYYRELQGKEEIKRLEGVEITRQAAAKKYGISDVTVLNWESQGSVRVIRPAKRRGMPTIVNEKDVAVMAGMRKRFGDGKSGPIKGWKPPIKPNNAY